MSVIERMAELLTPARPDAKSSAPREEASIPDLDLIERAVGESNDRSGFPDAEEIASRLVGLTPEEKAGAGLARAVSRTSRVVSIDLDRLSRQGFITPGGERTPIAESFRRIKRRILMNVASPKADVPANLVLVTSALAGEGKTFCALNLAISIALEVDHSVLLVAADVRKPSIQEVFGLNAEKGLMDLLVDQRIDLAELLCRTDIGELTFLPAGTANHRATELLASSAMRKLLREMAERYHDRVIIFDSPPLLAASEAGALASQVGQIVMVVESGKTPESVLKEALGRIDQSRLAGLVLNKGEGPGLGYYYGGYDYGGA